jgi:flagellar motor switch protein FliN/FliY
MSAAPSQSAVDTYVRTLLGGCAAAVSTLLGRSVALEPDGPPAEVQDLGAILPAPWVVAEACFTRGVAGAHQLVVPRDEALALAQLLLGNDPALPAVYGTEHDDALREMLNQMLSSASSALRVLLGRPTVLSLAELRHVDDPGAWSAHGAVVPGRLLVDGVPRARFALTIPASVQEELAAAQAAGAEAGPAPAAGPAGLELILDISMPVTVELGRTRMLIRDILALGPGSVVELDKLAGEPVELLVNDRPIAKGEVVVIDENFGVRLTQISQPTERIRSLQ